LSNSTGFVNETHVARIARELNLSAAQVRATSDLLGEGSTVPFIARYRKEATGSLDEVAITSIRDRLAQLGALDDRRAAITSSLEERNLLSEDLRAKLQQAETLATLEDIYLPFRPKRRTRASQARERGLEPLAELLLRQDPRTEPTREAAKYVTPEVQDVEAALQGARDIIAERASDDADLRARMRNFFWQRGQLRATVKAGQETTGARFRDYFDWSEPIRSAPSHRVLAVLRGETEDVLSVSIEPPEEDALTMVERAFVRGNTKSS
jgi:uncharacterized protein